VKLNWPFGPKITRLSSQVSVTGQISADDVAAIAEQGFRSIVNNRPDNESARQPTSDDIENAAKELGLAYEHIPVVSGAMTEQNLDDFMAACERLEGPILMFCRSGARCTMLWELSRLKSATEFPESDSS